MKIYLAGRISPGSHERNDWRFPIVPDLAKWNSGRAGPIAQGIFGIHDYTGPFWDIELHSHEVGSHGVNGFNDEPYGSEAAEVVNRDFNGIVKSDVVFAWIDQQDAYGTIAELGFAIGRDVDICLAGYRRYPEHWFVHEAVKAANGIVSFGWNDPAEALRAYLDTLGGIIPESPIEESFWNCWRERVPGEGILLVPQWEVLDGKYRFDFACPDRKIAIELDGYEYHSSREAFTKDRKRQRELESQGWRIIRFSGSEIHADAYACADTAIDMIRGYSIAAIEA